MTACHHKQANHQCGTNARYHLDGCRCRSCREAAAAYERKRIGWLVGATPHPYVNAEPVRQHVRSLVDAGMGLKRVAKVSGVPHGSLSKLMYGIKGERPPSRQVRRETAARLLAVEPDVSDGAKVDATEARAIVDELVARGWSRAEIGRRVHGPKARSLQVNLDGLVFARTIRVLRRLLAEPTPLRTHNPTGKLYRPNPDRLPRLVDPTTPGVPLDESMLIEWDRQRLKQAVLAARGSL